MYIFNDLDLKTQTKIHLKMIWDFDRVKNLYLFAFFSMLLKESVFHISINIMLKSYNTFPNVYYPFKKKNKNDTVIRKLTATISTDKLIYGIEISNCSK